MCQEFSENPNTPEQPHEIELDEENEYMSGLPDYESEMEIDSNFKPHLEILDIPRKSSFHRFRLLPPEIRIKIWKLIIPPPEPRILIITYDTSEDGERDTHFSRNLRQGRWKMTNPIRRHITAKFVCQESRHEARCWDILPLDSREDWSMFNYNTDTVFLTTSARIQGGLCQHFERRVLGPNNNPIMLSSGRLRKLAIWAELFFSWRHLFLKDSGAQVVCRRCKRQARDFAECAFGGGIEKVAEFGVLEKLMVVDHDECLCWMGGRTVLRFFDEEQPVFTSSLGPPIRDDTCEIKRARFVRERIVNVLAEEVW